MKYFQVSVAIIVFKCVTENTIPNEALCSVLPKITLEVPIPILTNISKRKEVKLYAT